MEAFAGGGAAAVPRAQAAHVMQRVAGGITLALGVGGTKSAGARARRNRHEKQRNNEGYGPRKVGAAVHRQLHPLMMMSAEDRKGSMHLSAVAGGRGTILTAAAIVNGVLRPAGLQPQAGGSIRAGRPPTSRFRRPPA